MGGSIFVIFIVFFAGSITDSIGNCLVWSWASGQKRTGEWVQMAPHEPIVASRKQLGAPLLVMGLESLHKQEIETVAYALFLVF